jgi:hypothetical protein
LLARNAERVLPVAISANSKPRHIRRRAEEAAVQSADEPACSLYAVGFPVLALQ